MGLIIGAANGVKKQDVAYALVLIWAYTGILIKHTAAGGFSGNYTEVVSTVTICIIILIVVTIYIAAGGKELLAKKG